MRWYRPPGPDCGRIGGTLALIQMPGAFHHVDGVDIELARDASLGLVFAEAEHADAGHQHHCRIRMPHGRRIWQRMLLVVLGVFAAICVQRCFRRSLNLRRIAGRIPVHKAAAGSWCG